MACTDTFAWTDHVLVNDLIVQSSSYKNTTEGGKRPSSTESLDSYGYDAILIQVYPWIDGRSLAVNGLTLW